MNPYVQSFKVVSEKALGDEAPKRYQLIPYADWRPNNEHVTQ